MSGFDDTYRFIIYDMIWTNKSTTIKKSSDRELRYR